MGLDRLKVDSIHTRRAGIGPTTTVRFLEHVCPVDLVPKAIEPVARFRLGFRL
jgi:hypothetical protein